MYFWKLNWEVGGDVGDQIERHLVPYDPGLAEETLVVLFVVALVAGDPRRNYHVAQQPADVRRQRAPNSRVSLHTLQLHLHKNLIPKLNCEI